MKCTVQSVRQETPHIKVISLLPEKKLVFRAGQFVMINFGVCKRAYSLASAPDEGCIELCVKIIPGGKGSALIDGWVPGDKVHIEGPYGKFLLAFDTPVLLVATGVGIAPFMSLLRSNTGQEITLVYGARLEQDFAYLKELLAFQHQGKLTLHLCVSQPRHTVPAYYQGRVTSCLQRMHLNPEVAVFVCGVPEAVRDIVAMLQDTGFPKEKIHQEVF